MPEVGEGDHRHLAGEELVDLLADRGVVVGPVDAAGLDDHAGQALLGDQPLGDLVRLVLGLLVVGGEARRPGARRSRRRPRRGCCRRRRSSRCRRPSAIFASSAARARSRCRARSPRTSPRARDSGIRPRRSRRRGSPRRSPRCPSRDRRRVGEVARRPARSRARCERLGPSRGRGRAPRTSSPRSRSLRTTWPPMNPVPPVTKTFIAVRAYPVNAWRSGR